MALGKTMNQISGERAKALAQNLVEILTSYEEELMALERDAPAMGQLRRAVGITIAEACYLITDQHYQSYNELMTQTDWKKYEKREDARCANCMMHCSVEPTIVRETGKNFRDMLTMIKWNLS